MKFIALDADAVSHHRLAFAAMRLIQKVVPRSIGLLVGRAYARVAGSRSGAPGLAFVARSVRFHGRGTCRFIGASYLHDGIEFRSNGSVTIADRVRVNVGTIFNLNEQGSVEIGKSTYVGPYCVIDAVGPILIGENTLIGPHCGFFSFNHGMSTKQSYRSQERTSVGITIGDNVWIGSGARILDGATIGSGSIVGAGAVVSASFPPYSLILGVPGKRVRSLLDDAARDHSPE